jgi:serine/threonine protein kinase
MAELNPRLHLRVGEIIRERYRILGELGSGGYATVYRAAQLNLGDREVALKVLAPRGRQSQNMPVAVERFLREARAAASIEHPNVVAIYDVDFLEDGRPYIVMQRVNGHSLSNEIDEFGPMHPARVLPRFQRTLAALGKAHDMGIVHRDIKPANILLTHPGAEEEEFKLIDFGVAHLQEEDQKTLTQVHTRVGTARYLAPEYLRFSVVTPALDVYQMGLVLAEMITGEPANPGDRTADLLQAARRGAVDVPDRLWDSSLGPVLKRALALEPADRYPNATAFRRALKMVDVAGVPTFSDGAQIRRRPSDSISRQRSGVLLADTGAHDVSQTRPKDGNTFTLAGGQLPSLTPSPWLTPVHELEESAVTKVARPAMVAPIVVPAAPREPEPTPLMVPVAPPTRPALATAVAMSAGVLFVAALGVMAIGLFFVAAEPGGASGPAEPESVVHAEAPATPIQDRVVSIVAEPRTALFQRGDDKLGVGSARIVFKGADRTPRRITVQAPGFKGTGVLVDPKGPGKLIVRLQPMAKVVEAPDPASVDEAAANAEQPAPPAAGSGNGKAPAASSDPPAAPRSNEKGSRPSRVRKTPKPSSGTKERPKRFRILE